MVNPITKKVKSEIEQKKRNKKLFETLQKTGKKIVIFPVQDNN